jgi:hypothetical protein
MAVAGLMCCVGSGCDGSDPTGLRPASLPELFGNQLFRADGTAVGVEALETIPVIGIYFASSGCPACGGFTPILVDAYNRLREQERPFEVVLVGLDVSGPSLFDFMVDSGMPWLAVSSQNNRPDALAQRYGVRWIPTLVIIDGAANTVSLNGREELASMDLAAYDAWLAASGGG